MQVSFSKELPLQSQALIILVNDSLAFFDKSFEVDKQCAGALTRAVENSKFKAEKGEFINVIAPNGVEYDNIFIVGVGKEKNLNALVAQNVGGKAFTAIKNSKIQNATLLIEGFSDNSEFAANFAYGFKLKSYSFDKYFVKKKQNDSNDNVVFNELSIILDNFEQSSTEYDKLSKIADGVFLSRDLVTEPPNVLYPESYAEIIKESFNENNVEVKVLGEKQLEKLGCGALLGVGQGSVRESKVVVIEYKGDSSSKENPIAFVGKGVTFDTGGISLKPSKGMEDMKYDMGGSAVVVGLMKALAGRQAKVNAIGIVGLVENMPGANAQRPSDVVTSMSGQTIEVLNTDAEGRLVLADALWYVQESYKPKNIIDLATLTGAIVVALGSEYAGLFSNSDELSEKILNASVTTDEKPWRFPLSEKYDKLLDSPIADMQNISSGRGAGSITAAQFLQRFIKEDVNWAHLDIAGVTWADSDMDLCTKGATGFGVRLLDKMVADEFEAK